MRRLTFVTALLLSVSFSPLHAQSLLDFPQQFSQARNAGKASWVLDIDNDSLLLNRNDGFYTSGARLSQQYALRDKTSLRIYGWRIGQELYTASDIKRMPAQIAPNDHPYAAWLYGGLYQETHRDDGTHFNFGVDVGCLGPCAGGEATQKSLHRLINQPQPQGWRTQVGTEWGAVAYADVTPVRWLLGDHIDVTPSVAGRFGNIHTDVNGGVTLRIGRLNRLPDQPTLHGFVRINGRAVGYDATLQGGYFSNDNARTVKPKTLVGEYEAGLVWQRSSYGLRASVVRRDNEIRDLPNAVGKQNFVRLQFFYTP